MIKQSSFLNFSEPFRKTLRSEKFLSEMTAVIPWNTLVDMIKPYYRAAQTGRKRKHLTMMLKIHFLQHWYNLSDPDMEDAIYDRNSFQKFLEIDMMSERAPDETTILNFRHLLEEHGLGERMFRKVNRVLEAKGLLLKKGTITDATIIAAPSSTKNKSGKRDPEMASTKKGNNWYFGMKAHTGTDKESGIVHTLEITDASVHDSKMFEELLHGKEKEVYGDKAYHSKEKARRFRARGIKWRVHQKAARGKELTPYQEARNHMLSKVRGIVERPFLVVKHLWGFRKVRYRGLYKNGVRLFISFMLANLFTVRKRILMA